MASFNGLERGNMGNNINNLRAFVKLNQSEYDGSFVFGPMYGLWWIEICCLLIITNSILRFWIVIIATPINIIATIYTLLYFRTKTLLKQNLYLAVLYLVCTCLSVILVVSIIEEYLHVKFEIYIMYISIVYFIEIVANACLIIRNLNMGNYLKNKRKISQETIFGLLGGLSAIITHAVLPQFSGDSQMYAAIVIFSMASCFCVATSTNNFIRVYLQKKYQIDEVIEVKKKKNN